MLNAGAIHELFDRYLCRPPTAADLAGWLQSRREPGEERADDAGRVVAGGLAAAARLQAVLGDSFEHREIVAPLLRVIRSHYQKFLLREATPGECRSHVGRVRDICGSDAAVVQALLSGSVPALLDARPINVEMDITNQCNLRCVMCPFSHPSHYQRPRAHMPVAVFERIAAQLFPAAQRVSLAYGTEPLLHREFTQFLTIGARYRVPKFFTITNGLLLTERIAEKMVEVGFHAIGVSIDAATAETYERIRVGGEWRRLIENLEMLQRIKARHGSDLPALGMNFVLMRDNVHELPAFVELARRLGARTVNAMHMIPFALTGKTAADSAVGDKALCNHMLREARRLAAEYGIGFAGPSEFALGDGAGYVTPDQAREGFDLNPPADWRQSTYCCFPSHFVAIDAFGNVIPCGWWSAEEAMGNVYEQDILAIWEGEQYRRLRAELAARRPRATCQRCPAAGMGSPDRKDAFAVR